MSTVGVGNRELLRWLLGLAVAGLSAFGLALLLGGGEPQAPPAGLPDAGRPLMWAVHAVPLLTLGAAVTTVGCATLPLLVGRSMPGPLRAVWLSATVWTALAVVEIGLAVWQAYAASTAWSTGALADVLGSTQSRGLEAEAVLAALTGLAATTTSPDRRDTTVTGWLRVTPLPLALAALVPSLLTGHVQTADAPVIAAVSLIAHVLAAALWVGGLGAMAWLAIHERGGWSVALPRFSTLALAAVTVLGVSGVVNALGQVSSLDALWTSGYGVLLVLKATLLGGLVGIGSLQRRHVVAVLERGRNRPTARRGRGLPVRAFLLLAGTELTLMTLAFALATALSQSPPAG